MASDGRAAALFPAEVNTGLRSVLRRTRFDVVGGVCVLVYLAYVLSSTGKWGHLSTGDSNNLVRGTRAAIRCLSNGEFFKCGYIDGTTNSYVHAYPLLQYLPAALVMSFGATDSDILRSLAFLNWLALIATLFAVGATFRRRHNLGLLAGGCIVLSSMTYQITTAFGESLVSAMVILSICAAIRRRPLELCVFVSLACMGKETLAPFVVALALVCARGSDDRCLPSRRLCAAVFSGAAVALVANLAFNLFRFGTFGNRFYLDPAWRTPGVLQKLRFGAALIASPSGGIIWYWPLLTTLAVAAGAIAVRRMRRSIHDVARWLPIAVVIAVLLTWLASLTAWWAPFGWVTYGPRLDVPLLGGVTVALVHLIGESLVGCLARSRVALEVAIGAVAVGSLQLGAPWRWPRVFINRFAAGDGCPSFGDLDVHRNAALYYRCVDRMIWRFDPPIVRDLLNLAGTSGAAAWFWGAAGAVLLLIQLRRPADVPSTETSAEGATGALAAAS